MHYAAKIDGKYYVCDSFKAVKFSEDMPFEPMPENLKNSIFNSSKIFPKSLNGYSELDLPDVSEVKTYIKIEKAKPENKYKKDFSWDFGEGKPAVNAQYLIDVMECFPEKVNAYFTNEKALIYFVSDDETTEAILMPVQ